jgi:hypothetical protein
MLLKYNNKMYKRQKEKGGMMSECKKILCPDTKKNPKPFPLVGCPQEKTVSDFFILWAGNGFGFFYLVGSLQEATVSDFLIFL